MRNIVFGIGVVQVVVSTLSTIGVGLYFGLTWQASFAVGGAMAISSTAIVTKLLTQQYELHLPHGNISLGVLLLQDLAVVPFLVLIPILASPLGGSLLVPISLALAKGALAFAVIYYAGQYLIRPAVRLVASAHSKECSVGRAASGVAHFQAWAVTRHGGVSRRYDARRNRVPAPH
jgi:CPA2 family monovalent cation:H+ antiporter-2